MSNGIQSIGGLKTREWVALCACTPLTGVARSPGQPLWMLFVPLLPVLALIAMELRADFGLRLLAPRLRLKSALLGTHVVLLSAAGWLIVSGQVPWLAGVTWKGALGVLSATSAAWTMRRLHGLGTVLDQVRGSTPPTTLTADELSVALWQVEEAEPTDPVLTERIVRIGLKTEGPTLGLRMVLALALDRQGRLDEAIALYAELQNEGADVSFLLEDCHQRASEAEAPKVEPRSFPVLIALFRPAIGLDDWFDDRLERAAFAVAGIARRVDRAAVVQFEACTLRVTPQEGPWRELYASANWARWPEGEALSGLSLTVEASEVGAAAVDCATRLVTECLQLGGVGVIVPASGRVWPAHHWFKVTGESGGAPLGGFFDLGRLQGEPGILCADGLAAWGLPRVLVDVSGLADAEQWSRGNLVAAWTGAQLLSRARPWIEGDVIEIPFGAEVGAMAPEVHNPRLAEAPIEAWRVEARSEDLLLRCERPWSFASTAAFTAPSGFLPYRWAMKLSLFGDTKGSHVGRIDERREPNFEILAWPEGDGFLTSTLGLGRWPQPRGEELDCRFSELSVHTRRHSALLAKRLARLALYFTHRGDEAPWGSWHRVSIEGLGIGDPQFPWLILSPLRTHTLGSHQVVMWSPVLVTPEERSTVATDLIDRWLTPAKRDQLMGRWLVGVPDDA